MNGFNVKLKSLMEMFLQMLRHMAFYFKAYGNVLACINIYIHIKLYMYAYVKAL